MPTEIINAAINGNSDVLVQLLELMHEDPREVMITIGKSHSAPEQTEVEHTTALSELTTSATRFGDTLLHLLISRRHNELALRVFLKEQSLLQAHNNKFETPLHTAAKVGNEEVVRDLIQLNPDEVRDTLSKTNANGDTALHVAANHNHKDLVCELMRFDPEAAYKGNTLGFSPLYIAAVEGHTSMVQAMLQVDAALPCTKFSDGTFLVHVAARMGNSDLVVHFLQKYPDYAELLDPCRRNLFHMAAEQKDEKVFTTVFALATTGRPDISQMIESMINSRDYEGNTPLHIAAMKGHSGVMRAIWNKLNQDPGALLRNQKGETAFDLSVIQVRNTNEVYV
ncbi:hypothetical protein LUZ61_012253 [Rhynchospora tenuis]|uniref:Uncharacterized protein n=1 Tax=Rhynchospora tenuis TaxID=198213 RepID=A0AAD6A307_9POAL|nr:hypothetical protein LUZ61_012253 [Rhynchospora tenuis]